MQLRIRTRLTLVTAVMMAIVLVFVAVFIYVRLASELTATVDSGLRSRADQIVTSLDGSGGGVSSGGNLIDADEAFAQVIAGDGSVVESSPGLSGAPLLSSQQLAALGGQEQTYESDVTTIEEQVPARLLAVPLSGGDILVVGTTLEDQNDALNSLAALLAVGGVVAILLSGLVGWIVAGSALRPVERMRTEAAAITTSKTGSRLAVPATGDELARLAETLNEMLERLEEALARERRFVADASHELRTPLSNLKAEIELALNRPRTDGDLQAALVSAGEETNRLIQLAQDLLVLARAEDDRLALTKEHVDARALVQEEVATFAGKAAQQQVTLRVAGDVDTMFELDGQRMRQVLANSLDNALRHSPANSEIVVTVTANGEGLHIDVTDEGEGFPADFLSKAFEPFSRADVGRTRSDGGTGLGLALSRAIVEAHGGVITAVNNGGGGATVKIRIPKSP